MTEFRSLDPEIIRDIYTGAVTPDRLELYDPSEIRRTKAGAPGAWRTIANAVVKAVDADEQSITYAATVQAVDRMGDIIVTRPTKALAKPSGDPLEPADQGRGFLTDQFEGAGAPFLWSHMSSSPAIGQVIASSQKQIEIAGGTKAWATLQKVRYLVEDVIPFAVPAWILVEEKIARSVSVGFVPVLVWWPGDEKVRKKLGLRRWGVVFLTSDQTELSQAQTPANQFALAQGPARGFERQVDEALDRMAKDQPTALGIKVTPALIKDFRAALPLGPLHEREVLHGKVAGFLDTGSISDDLAKILGADDASALYEELTPEGPEERAAAPVAAEEPDLDAAVAALAEDVARSTGASVESATSAVEAKLSQGATDPSEFAQALCLDLGSDADPGGDAARELWEERLTGLVERVISASDSMAESISKAADAVEKGGSNSGGSNSERITPTPGKLELMEARAVAAEANYDELLIEVGELRNIIERAKERTANMETLLEKREPKLNLPKAYRVALQKALDASMAALDSISIISDASEGERGLDDELPYVPTEKEALDMAVTFERLATRSRSMLLEESKAEKPDGGEGSSRAVAEEAETTQERQEPDLLSDILQST